MRLGVSMFIAATAACGQQRCDEHESQEDRHAFAKMRYTRLERAETFIRSNSVLDKFRAQQTPDLVVALDSQPFLAPRQCVTSVVVWSWGFVTTTFIYGDETVFARGMHACMHAVRSPSVAVGGSSLSSKRQASPIRGQ